MLRRANGMTQAELAEKLAVSNKSVSKWECDEGYPDVILIPILREAQCLVESIESYYMLLLLFFLL